jgi:hypothetical protein
MSYKDLKTAIQEAWETLSYDYFDGLLEDMYKRCQAVIDAQGGHCDGLGPI